MKMSRAGAVSEVEPDGDADGVAEGDAGVGVMSFGKPRC